MISLYLRESARQPLRDRYGCKPAQQCCMRSLGVDGTAAESCVGKAGLYNLPVLRALLAGFLFLVTTVRASDLDSNLARIMHGRSGTAVVVEVGSGHVLAAYRPEVAARRLARPGSAFKPFTLPALLQSGKLSATDSLVCRRTLHVGAHNLSCGHPQVGPLQAVSALAYSCNDFFATFGGRLTAAELHSAFTSAGFASPSGFVADEAVGFIHPAQSNEERQLQAVGEGDMKITPLEMLAASSLPLP